MHLGFAFNPTKPAAVELRDRALEWCRGRAVEAWSAEASEEQTLLERLPASDVLVVLGGDGTFLRAARVLAAVDVPVLGVNSGRIGFLAKVEPDALEETLAELVAGEYEIEPRMMLEARLLPGGGEAGSTAHAALNDAAIVRGAEVRVVRLEVLINDTHLANYVADGLVVATPTGSTAYSFSAGGPILDPTARNLIVTPIAAYLSSIRSIVVDPAQRVLVRVLDGPDCVVSIDGREDHPLKVGDAVDIRALDRPLRFVEPRRALPFWELLRRKAALLPA
ncbi:MAG TPA: NAD(+)/NADH kinase [Candidatus Limnocylindria bacterium]|jgi:NAD+ kinase|nr:NAD(+)/NADH kinase [Candidatus Limnocylindria bacterium]